jgi:DNA-binding beta-propeller fold protein YncE
VVPSTYPVSIAINRSGSRAYVALWNGSAVAELDLDHGKVLKQLALLAPREATSPSSHPTAFAWGQGEKTLYVALANRDAVAAMRVGGAELKLEAVYDTRLPGQTYFGAMPDAVAVSEDGKRLFAANTGSDAVAVFDLQGRKAAEKAIPALAWVPTEWYPTALAVKGNMLYVATAKGQGTGPNNMPQASVAGVSRLSSSSTYIATLLHGSLAAIDLSKIDGQREQLTRTVIETNMMKAAQAKIAFRGGTNPIRHVIYIIKENRTYDQILGDLGVGNGSLARQFGVLDNFYDSGEVSGDGHVWSNAAISSDYNEKTWQQSYRGNERVYDYEGVVENGYPLLEGISDVNEPGSGYLWTDLARNGKSLYHFAEYISTTFCSDPESPAPQKSPTEGTPEPAPEQCGAHGSIRHGESIPQNYGGGTSPYPWPIPLIKRNVATKPELVGHFDPLYPTSI